MFTSRWFCAKLGPSKGRGPLNTKRAPALKKGYGAIGLGRHTNSGFFLIDTRLVPQFHVPPDLATCDLKPYVSRRTPNTLSFFVSMFSLMSEKLLEEVKILCTPGKLKGLKEAEAPAAIAVELERLQKIQRFSGLLQKMAAEFPQRKSQLSERYAKYKKDVSAEIEADKLRVEKIQNLNKRQAELSGKAKVLTEALKIRQRNLQIGQVQRQEVWQLILRMADLVNGINKTRAQNSSADETRQQSDVEILEVLLRTNSDRIVNLETQLEHLQSEISSLQVRDI